MKRFGLPIVVLFIAALSSMIIFSLSEDQKPEE
jgi:hypothetical protein